MKEVTNWQEGLAAIMYECIPDFVRARKAEIMKPYLTTPQIVAKRRERRVRRHIETALGCDDEWELKNSLSHPLPENLTVEFQGRLLSTGVKDHLAKNMEKPYGSTLEIDGEDGQCDVCPRTVYHWRGCYNCRRSCRYARRMHANPCAELGRPYIWRCFEDECPWPSHVWIRRERRCNDCLLKRRAPNLRDETNRRRAGLRD